MAVSLLGKGSLFFGSAEPRMFADFANGNFLTLDFGNQISTKEMGRGGTIIAYNSNQEQATLTVRLVKASPDDLYLNGVLSDYKRSPETFVLFTGSLSISNNDGSGSATMENFLLTEGCFINQPNFTTDSGGDVEGGVAVWIFDVRAVRNLA